MHKVSKITVLQLYFLEISYWEAEELSKLYQPTAF